MTILTTRQVAQEITASLELKKPLQTWQVRRLYELGDLPEPGKFGNKRVATRDDIPVILIALRKRGWIPAATDVSGGH